MAKHDFYLDAEGKRDDWRLEVNDHNGPQCRRCGEAFCLNCHPEELEAECEGLDGSAYVTVVVSYLPAGATTDNERTSISHRAEISAEEMATGAAADPVVRQLLRGVDVVREAWERRQR